MTLADDFALVHTPARDAVELVQHKNAARRISEWLFAYLTRIITVSLVPPRDVGRTYTTKADPTNGTVTVITTGWFPGESHSAFDWERLRVNVAHFVSPSIVKWRAA